MELELFDAESPTGGLVVLLVDASGREAAVPAVAWAEGPTVAGKGNLLWCLVPEARTPVAVMRVTRRHRGRGGLGRYFDPGEAYADASTASRASRAPVVRDGWGARRAGSPPWSRWAGPGSTRIVVKPLPTAVYKALSNEG